MPYFGISFAGSSIPQFSPARFTPAQFSLVRSRADAVGLLISLAFVLAVLLIVGLLVVFRAVSGTGGRKIVHIAVSHWWIVLMVLPMHTGAALVGPVLFVALNAAVRVLARRTSRTGGGVGYARYSRALQVLGGEPAGGSAGTVYFPLSLIALVLLCVDGPLPRSAGLAGSLAMGWGDGLAALVGTRVTSPAVTFAGSRRSVAGTAAMTGACFIIFTALLILTRRVGLAGAAGAAGTAGSLAVLAAALELVTPFGLDNISVPLGTAATWSLIAQ